MDTQFFKIDTEMTEIIEPELGAPFKEQHYLPYKFLLLGGLKMFRSAPELEKKIIKQSKYYGTP